MQHEIEDRLLTILSEASEIPKKDITPESRLDDLNFDSLVLIELSLKLRKDFGIIDLDDELMLLETVEELFQLVKKHQTT